MGTTDDGPNTPKLPISYHTFIYPFTYKDNLEEWISRDKKRWEQFHLHHLGTDDSTNSKQRLLDFNEYQYFLPKARSLLFSENKFDRHESVKGDASIFYGYKTGAGKASYTIVKKIDNNLLENQESLSDEFKEKKGYYVTSYELSINQLILQLFPEFKTGVFTFELEYYGERYYAFLNNSSDPGTCRRLGDQEYNNLLKSLNKYEETVEQQINVINNYGRRVGIPCLGVENNNDLRAILNADQIIVSGLQNDDEDQSIVIDFNEIIHKSDNADLEISMDLVTRIMFRGQKASKRYDLKPVLDDRMFTACLFRKSNYLPLYKTASYDLRNSIKTVCGDQYGKGDTYRYLEPELYRTEAETLYRFIFLEDSIACCNIHMLKDKLKEHVLGRWVDVGTIHAATEYSLVCVTGEDAFLEKAVINPFLTIYVDMVKLALIQRAIITNLEYEGQRISNDINNQVEENQESESVLNAVERLWQKYISFENQIYLPEVTFQEQGVEIYDIIKRSLRLKELNDYVKEGIINLNNIATLKAERNRIRLERAEQHSNDLISKNLNMLSIVGVSLALITFVVNFISAGQMFLWDENVNGVLYLVFSVIQLAGIGAMLWFLYKYYRKKLIEHNDVWTYAKSDSRINGENKRPYTTKNEVDEKNDALQQYIMDIWKKPLIILFLGILFIIVFMTLFIKVCGY